MVQAIIFDMDGVIVDTEYVDFQFQQEFIKSISKFPDQLTHEDFSSLVSKSYRNLTSSIKQLSQTELSLDQIASQLQSHAHEALQKVSYADLFRTDILKIIAYSKKHDIKLAVASSSRKDHILEVLEDCGIVDQFDHIVSGEDFEESKPHPAIYQFALERLQVSAGDAIAVEDSYYGIQAAKSAGIPVIAYHEERMLVDQSHADYKRKNMTEIFELIKSL